MKEKFNNTVQWIFAHPKQVYKYSMIVIIISFGFTITQYFFFPPEFKTSTLVPNLYSNSDDIKAKEKLREVELTKIIKEMQMLKAKNEAKQLTKDDSVRLQYLYSEYKKLTNGF